MSSRDSILAAVARNQPARMPLPEIPAFDLGEGDPVEKFAAVAVSVGSRVFRVKNLEEVKQTILNEHIGAKRIVSGFQHFSDMAETSVAPGTDPHTLADVDLAILPAQLGVAENSALWVTEAQLPLRVLPFICQHLALVVSQQNIVPLMHQAYEVIGTQEYGFGTFIAGPSKTADIEQSLVLGAHGARTLSVFILEE